ncbi:MAG: hypothetical protein ACK49N_07360 [Verrucomicrobiota bacterium]
MILGVSCALSAADVHWRGFLIATQIAASFNVELRPHAGERLRVFIQDWRDKQPKLVA